MMPAEGPNPSEELLKRHAKRRREQGGDFSLHPATRGLLQGEVARRYGASAGQPARSWLGAWWWRGVLGAAAAAVAFVFWHQVNQPAMLSPTTELAKAELKENIPARPMAPSSQLQKEKQSDADAPPASLAFGANLAEVASTSPANAAQELAVRGATPAVREIVTTPPAAGPLLGKALVAVPPPAPAEARQLGFRTRMAEDRLSTASKPAAPAVAEKGAAPAGNTQALPRPTALPPPRPLASSLPAPTDRFLREEAVALSAPAARSRVQPTAEELGGIGQRAPGAEVVLDRFVVEQQGKIIRIVDGDGSVYVGELATAATEKLESDPVPLRRYSIGATRDKAVANQPQSSDSFYSFRATGTNRTLQQNVTIDGRYSAEQSSNAARGGAAPLAARYYRLTNSTAVTNQSAPIEGRLWFDTSTNRQFFRARPMQR